MYFYGISSYCIMWNNIDRRDWYLALYWANKYLSEGGYISEETWERILYGLVEFDERYDTDYKRKHDYASTFYEIMKEGLHD